MSVALNDPWTIESFLTWAGRQEERFEFNGFVPEAMTGGSARHGRIISNIHVALRSRLKGTGCSAFGPDLGVLTINNAVRYPDQLVTCTQFPDTELLAPGVKIVFEVISPDSDRRHRVQKMREYAGVASIQHYVIVETDSAGLWSMSRASGDDPWTLEPLTAEDSLALPVIGAIIPVIDIYEGVAFVEPA